MDPVKRNDTVPVITAFESSPDRGKGLARDMQVRWAFEEVGQPYDVRLVSFDEMRKSAHVKLQPFGQIPTYEEGGVSLFESGAIVLHIAQRHAGLLPSEQEARARAIMWMFAAQSTVEPPIVDCERIGFFERHELWFDQRLKMAQDRIRERLAQLSFYLGDRDWLERDFSAGDLLMVGVLRRLRESPLLQEFQNLTAYVLRAESRSTFKAAFAAQLAVFQAASEDDR